MRKYLVLAVIVVFVVSAIPVFAGGGGDKAACSPKAPDTVFQSTARGLTGFESWIKGEKSTYTGTPTGAFQGMKNFIDKTITTASSATRSKSLRGRPDELARRRR